MPLYTNASICFPAYGLCFSFEPRKPAAFVRTASSFEGRENHKLCLFCLKWGENIGIICLGGASEFSKRNLTQCSFTFLAVIRCILAFIVCTQVLRKTTEVEMALLSKQTILFVKIWSQLRQTRMKMLLIQALFLPFNEMCCEYKPHTTELGFKI